MAWEKYSSCLVCHRVLPLLLLPQGSSSIRHETTHRERGDTQSIVPNTSLYALPPSDRYKTLDSILSFALRFPTFAFIHCQLRDPLFLWNSSTFLCSWGRREEFTFPRSIQNFFIALPSRSWFLVQQEDPAVPHPTSFMFPLVNDCSWCFKFPMIVLFSLFTTVVIDGEVLCGYLLFDDWSPL